MSISWWLAPPSTCTQCIPRWILQMGFLPILHPSLNSIRQNLMVCADASPWLVLEPCAFLVPLSCGHLQVHHTSCSKGWCNFKPSWRSWKPSWTKSIRLHTEYKVGIMIKWSTKCAEIKSFNLSPFTQARPFNRILYVCKICTMQ